MIVKIQQKLRRTVVAAAVQVVEDDHKLFTAPLAALKNLTRTKTNVMLMFNLTRAFLTLSKIIGTYRPCIDHTNTHKRTRNNTNIKQQPTDSNYQ